MVAIERKPSLIGLVCFLNDSYSFKVEAYKQPKFTVSLTKPNEVRRFGQTARIEGVAASYTAVPVSGAKVEYIFALRPISSNE